MSEPLLPTEVDAPATVVLRWSSTADAEQRVDFVQRVARLFPHLNWRAHLYLLPAEPVGSCDNARAATEAVCSFLAAHSFAAMVLHPFVRLRSESTRGSYDWSELLSPAKPFREEAYHLQGEPRLMISPVLETGPGAQSAVWRLPAKVLRAGSSHPSVVLDTPPARNELADDEQAPRFYVVREPGTEARVDALATSHVVESALARLEQTGADLLAACRPHLLIDEASDMVFACFQHWRAGRALCSLADWQRGVSHADGVPSDGETCAACLSRSLLAADDDLRANSREPEAHRLHFEVALAMARREQFAAAAKHAQRAADLAGTDVQRGSALLHEGLSHMSAGNLEAAEAALARASELAEDPGIVAYHRGRNQLDWRDYIEALERFEEALESGSAAVPSKDLFFQMALCHVRLEEYSDARPYIARWRDAGGDAASISFYEALCDLGEGATETALGEFREALAAGPQPSDRGRVLFYIGHCLKELDRFGDAIDPLRRAREIDPDDLAICNLLGFCYYKAGRHREAVECFRRAIEIDPSSGIDHANLASNLRDLGRIDEAIRFYEKALELDPTIGFARTNLATLRSSGGTTTS